MINITEVFELWGASQVNGVKTLRKKWSYIQDLDHNEGGFEENQHHKEIIICERQKESYI